MKRIKKEKVVKCPYVDAVTDYQDFSHRGMGLAERRKINIGDIWSNKIQCKHCKWYIRSKNKHDFRYCKCGLMAVDGGSWYQIISGNLDGYINYIEYYDDYKKEKI